MLPDVPEAACVFREGVLAEAASASLLTVSEHGEAGGSARVLRKEVRCNLAAMEQAFSHPHPTSLPAGGILEPAATFSRNAGRQSAPPPACFHTPAVESSC